MFTGLVQDVGEILETSNFECGVRLKIRTGVDLSREKIGASIACSGCCLTVVEKGDDWFAVDVSQESLSKTVIGDWKAGTKINIEPSLRMGDELGGHFVFGHVDGVAELVSLEQEGESWRLFVRPPEPLMRFVAPKGSVSLDGISLTVNEVLEDRFGVNIIPHTREHTTLKDRKAGDVLHIEVDMLARYVERQLQFSRS